LKKSFYSNGKLLITGEYLVLDGANAFALPTRFGQYLHVEPSEGKLIKWTSFDVDDSVWFDDVILFNDIISNNKQLHLNTIKSTLIEVLHEAFKLNPDFIHKSNDYTISTTLTFAKKWGLGTSSTLINNISNWLEIDAFMLLKNRFGGSGYDIACAKNNSPIIYTIINNNPTFKTVDFNPDFKDAIYFVYLNKKQNSKSAIANYLNNKNKAIKHIKEINTLTQNVINANTLANFNLALEKHENILSDILELQTIKESLFLDFKGTIKSLGAWGGDFIMVIAKENPAVYFKQKGYNTILKYSDMIL